MIKVRKSHLIKIEEGVWAINYHFNESVSDLYYPVFENKVISFAASPDFINIWFRAKDKGEAERLLNDFDRYIEDKTRLLNQIGEIHV